MPCTAYSQHFSVHPQKDSHGFAVEFTFGIDKNGPRLEYVGFSVCEHTLKMLGDVKTVQQLITLALDNLRAECGPGGKLDGINWPSDYPIYIGAPDASGESLS